MLLIYIFQWRNSDCEWSILANQLIYVVNARANVCSPICISFGEKLSVFSLHQYFLYDLVHIRNSENWCTWEQICRYIDVMMMFGCVVNFTFDGMIVTHHLNPSQIPFPYISECRLIMGRWRHTWIGQSTGAQKVPSMTALMSTSHWVSHGMPDDSMGSFPPFHEPFLWASAPCPPPPPLYSQKAV